MNELLLLVDDDDNLIELLGIRFESRGFRVVSAFNGREGLRLACEKHPDLIVLDIMLPEIDGFEICQRLRDMSDVPILMLSARTRDEDVLRAFQDGADDYIRKPFDIRELEARIQALLKRAHRMEQVNSIYDDGRLRIDLEQGHVYRQGYLVHLTPTEFRLLSCLVRRPGRVVSHVDLVTKVWGTAYLDATACLSLYIRYLREKLEENSSEPQYICTQWGVGYWFAPTPHAIPPPAHEMATYADSEVLPLLYVEPV